MKLTITFQTPRVFNFSNPNSSTLEFQADFAKLGSANIRIERNSEGFTYTDVGFFTRQFSTAAELIWEFHYPEHLKSKLKALTPKK
jgi:hypothetical protein